MKIYFAGAIRGGRDKVNDYEKIIHKLQELGEVLTVHVADKNLSSKGEENLSLNDIYDRDMRWLEEADLVVAEVSMASLGIGYELGVAEKLGKRVICFYDTSSTIKLSAMIGGNKYFEIVKYNKIEEVLNYIEKIN